MTTHSTIPPSRTYKVTSLERGLDVLRVIRSADGPVRNRDIATRTELPKATVSRLVHTLTVMGYLRRIDEGSYVLGGASSRTGRAMLEGLRLERYAPFFEGLVAAPGAYACLMMYVDGKMAPVFRWSADGSRLLARNANAHKTIDEPLLTACLEHLGGSRGIETFADADQTLHQLIDRGWCQQWREDLGRLTACAGVRLSAVALCLLVVQLPQSVHPTQAQLVSIGASLLLAAKALASESTDKA